MELQVGQKLWFVQNDRHSHVKPVEVTVSKVGREWAHFTENPRLRINVKTLHSDNSSGRAYFSVEEYETKRATEAEWLKLADKMHRTYRMPDGVTVEKIEQARKLLGL